MQARAKFLGHPAHQMMIVFPLGLLATSVIFDYCRIASGSPSLGHAAYWTMVAGVIGGIPSALLGWIDWTAIPAGTRAKRVGLTHGIGNMVVLYLFAQSFMFRYTGGGEGFGVLAVALSTVGLLVACVTGWLGGELVDRLAIGVDPGANPDAPSSLRRPTPAA